MLNHDFILTNADTDSIMFCKKDQSPFTEDEQQKLLDEINNILPNLITFENDGHFSRVLIVKSKNYALYKGDEIKYKGSAFKSATKEKALGELLKLIVEALIHETDTPVNIYNRYIREAMNITDIKRWATKKSITKKLLNGTRKNETKVLDAIEGDSVQEGDKIYLYSAIDGEIQDVKKGEPQFYKDGRPKMVENKVLRQIDEFDGNYDCLHYVKRVYDTLNILKTVIDMEQIPKYHLSKNVHLLDGFKV